MKPRTTTSSYMCAISLAFASLFFILAPHNICNWLIEYAGVPIENYVLVLMGLALLVASIIITVRTRRRFLRHVWPFCEHCGNDLRGSVTGRCTEFGHDLKQRIEVTCEFCWEVVEFPASFQGTEKHCPKCGEPGSIPIIWNRKILESSEVKPPVSPK